MVKATVDAKTNMVAHWAPNYKNHIMKIIYISFLNWQSLHYKHEKICPQISQVTELFLLNFGKPLISLTGVLISFISLILLQPLQTSKLTKNQQNTFVLVLFVKIFYDDYTLNYKPLVMLNLKIFGLKFYILELHLLQYTLWIWTWRFISDKLNSLD